MILCITEKPSVAKDIANILGASSRQEGFFEGNGYLVSWTYGHLCMLKEPSDYTQGWKKWALSYLPMIPQRFGIKVIDQPSIKRQFKVLETLIGKCDEVINCGDAGQEGELIQRWVMQKADCHVPVKRLWISSLTDESIRKGFQELKPQSDYDNLYYAGLSRAIGDWILGMNATRLYSLKYSSPGNVLSIGRVQTPTLALIVKRHFEIVNFRPEDFWELKTLYRDVLFNATSGKFTKIEKANEALEKIKGKPFTVTDVQHKKGKESPPRLFDLTSLQVECNKLFGWTADETLKLIQSCYEKKVTTYPRVDTTYLTDDIYPQVPVILQKMTPYAPLTASILSKKLPKSKKVFDNSKVTDHHAIIPTGESPAVLVGNERQLYHLIAMRFIAAFYPDCVFSQTTVIGKVEDTEFKAVGKVIIDPGWRALFDKPKPKPDPNKQQAQNSQAQSNPNANNNGDEDSDSDKDDSEDRILPPMTVGESGPHQPSLLKKTTQPPKYYTEGTLLRAMETAGKTVDDEALREAMKENGIGRPSTRSAIIETLFKRRYIERKRKQIIPTPAGIQLIGTIKEELLKSAKLTGLWENKLRKIEKGEYTAAHFIDELKEMIHKITFEVMTESEFKKIEIDNKEHSHHNGSTTSSTGGNASSTSSGNNKKSSGTKSSSGSEGSGSTTKRSRKSSSSTTSTGKTTRSRSKKLTDNNAQPNSTGTTNGATGTLGVNPPSTSTPTPTPTTPTTSNPNGQGQSVNPNNPGSHAPGTNPNGNTGNPGTYPPPAGYPNGYNPNYTTGYIGAQGNNPTANPNGYTGYPGNYPQGYPTGYNGGYPGTYPQGYNPPGYPNNPNSQGYPNPQGYPTNQGYQNNPNGQPNQSHSNYPHGYPQGYQNNPNNHTQGYPTNPGNQNNPYGQGYQNNPAYPQGYPNPQGNANNATPNTGVQNVPSPSTVQGNPTVNQGNSPTAQPDNTNGKSTVNPSTPSSSTGQSASPSSGTANTDGKSDNTSGSNDSDDGHKSSNKDDLSNHPTLF